MCDTDSMKPIRGGLLSAVGGALLVLLLITAAALAATGDLTQPAGTAGCISETGAGSCADGRALHCASAVAVSPDGKSVYVVASEVSDAVVRLNRNPTTGAITQPAGSRRGASARPGRGRAPTAMGSTARLGSRSARTGRASTSPRTSAAPWRASTATRPPGRSPSPPGAPAASARRGAGGPCADGHGFNSRDLRWRSAPTGRASTSPPSVSNAVVRLNRNTTTGAISQPAGAAGCISHTGAGPCADGHGLDRAALRWRSAPTGRASTSPPPATPWCASSRNTTTGAISQPAGSRRLHQPTGGGALRRRPRALPRDGGGSQPGREERLRRLQPSSPWCASLATRPPGRLAQPAGTAGCLSETGAGPCADGHGLGIPHSVAVSARREERLRRLGLQATPWCASTRNTTTGALSQPAGTAGCISETGAGPCADGRGLDSAHDVAVSADGKSVYVASYF